MKAIIIYAKDSYDELVNKVSWPKMEDLQKSTVVVIIASAIFALLVMIMDLFSKNVMKGIYNLIG